MCGTIEEAIRHLVELRGDLKTIRAVSPAQIVHAPRAGYGIVGIDFPVHLRLSTSQQFIELFDLFEDDEELVTCLKVCEELVTHLKECVRDHHDER